MIPRMDKKRILKILVKERPEIIARLQKVVDEGRFDYTTFGKHVEAPLIKIIIDLLKEEGIITKNEQFKIAENKNQWPDLIIFSKPEIALEIKAGNRSKKGIGGRWGVCKNSNNDLMTLNMLQGKLNKFGGENIFFVFVEYDFTDTKKKIIDIKIDQFYKFVGLNSAGLLSYREKDGNLRPKDFDASPPIKSLQKFVELVSHTIYYRSRRIIRKHQSIIRKLISEGFVPRSY